MKPSALPVEAGSYPLAVALEKLWDEMKSFWNRAVKLMRTQESWRVTSGLHSLSQRSFLILWKVFYSRVGHWLYILQNTRKRTFFFFSWEGQSVNIDTKECMRLRKKKTWMKDIIILAEKRLGVGDIFQKLPSLWNNNASRKLQWKMRLVSIPLLAWSYTWFQLLQNQRSQKP